LYFPVPMISRERNSLPAIRRTSLSIFQLLPIDFRIRRVKLQ
jgi:hypothetical protein